LNGSLSFADLLARQGTVFFLSLSAGKGATGKQDRKTAAKILLLVFFSAFYIIKYKTLSRILSDEKT
jgi:hypothetical protein